METKMVEIKEAKTKLKDLLSLVVTGSTEIVFTKDKEPVARLSPIENSDNPRIMGLHPGSIWTSDDFDEPLIDES